MINADHLIVMRVVVTALDELVVQHMSVFAANLAKTI
jgi:hypothetical protein